MKLYTVCGGSNKCQNLIIRIWLFLIVFLCPYSAYIIYASFSPSWSEINFCWPSSSNDFSSQMQRIVINGKEYKINCNLIAPYQEVLQHAGYTKEGLTAVMVFQARKLPAKNVRFLFLFCNKFFYFTIISKQKFSMGN